jgi:hypothetical protein
VQRDTLDRLTDLALRSLDRDAAACTPHVLSFLLRRLRSTAREDIRDAMGWALAEGFARARVAAGLDEQAAWIDVLVTAAPVCDDARIRETSDALVNLQRRHWVPTDGLLAKARSISACLHAVPLMPEAGAGIARDAVDELERVVDRAYDPGHGLTPADLHDQLAFGLTLIDAFHVTGRLPYAMLAEELLQVGRRTGWNQAAGTFGELVDDRSFLVNCDAACLLSAVARLHGAADYQEAAVVAPGCDYRDEAACVMGALTEACENQPLALAARFGVVLIEFTHV